MNDNGTFHTVGGITERFSLTMQTPHHQKARGLFAPAERGRSNYRLYSVGDCIHIQRIIIYWATGMGLTDVKALLDPDEPGIFHLGRQRERLITHRQETDKMIEALDILLEDAMNDNALTVERIGEILGDADFAAYQTRTEECYGETDDWKEWHRCTVSWQAGDWQANTERIRRVESDMIDAVRARAATGGDRAAKLADAHREALSKCFPVSPAKYYLISRAYPCDESSYSHHDSQQEGFAQQLADAAEHVVVARGVNTDDPQRR